MSAHARIAPSAAARWVACPPSVALSDGLPDTPNKYAALGTAKHKASERILLGQRSLETVEREYSISGFDIELSDEDIEHVRGYIEYVERLERSDGELMHVEQKLDLSSFIPKSKGTADAIIIEPCYAAHVIDAKFGSGVKVEADCLQLACYAIGAWDRFADSYMLEEVTVHVAQPPLNHYDSHTYTGAQLEEMRAWLSSRAQLAHEGKGVYALGDHCRWCPAKIKCPEMKKQAAEKAEQMFVPVGKKKLDAPEYDPKELAEFMALVPALDAWAKAVKEQAKAQLEQGHEVPGYKLVAGRRTRSWADEEKLVKYLRRKKMKIVDIYEKVLRSPAQMEKHLQGATTGTIDLDSQVEWKSGSPTIAPATDKRPAISTGAELAFDDITK